MYFSDAMAYNQQAAQAQYVLAAQMQQAGQVVQQQQAAQQVRAPQVIHPSYTIHGLLGKMDLWIKIDASSRKCVTDVQKCVTANLFAHLM